LLLHNACGEGASGSGGVEAAGVRGSGGEAEAVVGVLISLLLFFVLQLSYLMLLVLLF